MSRGSTPRHAQMAGDMGFAVQFNAETPWYFAQVRLLSSGRIVPRKTIGMLTLPVRDLMPTHAIAGNLRLPRPTPAHALMRVLHWLRC